MLLDKLGRLSNGAPVYGPSDPAERDALYAQIVGLEERLLGDSVEARIAFYGLNRGEDLLPEERLERLERVAVRVGVAA